MGGHEDYHCDVISLIVRLKNLYQEKFEGLLMPVNESIMSRHNIKLM